MTSIGSEGRLVNLDSAAIDEHAQALKELASAGFDVLSHFVRNARRLAKQSQHVSRAAYLCGIKAHSLCVWCADKPEHRSAHVWRLPLGGECDQCSYVGYDCLVVEGSDL